MAYSDFTFAKLKQKFGLEQQDILLFSSKTIDDVTPSNRLIVDINERRVFPVYTEKAKSEIIIYPILRELKLRNPQINVFSGYTFNIETEKDLNGSPDFIITSKPNITELRAPVFCIVESKNKAPDEGFTQCAAEMYASRLFNEQNNEPIEIIYGAVTNAYDWIFLKLEKNIISVDIDRYNIIELPKLLGILQYIVDQTKPK